MTPRASSAASTMGFDAIEPDNMDVHDNDSGFPITAGRKHCCLCPASGCDGSGPGWYFLGLKIAQKNVPDLTEDLVDTFDFAICGKLLPGPQLQVIFRLWLLKAGTKPVFNAEYTDRPIHFSKACEIARRNTEYP